MLLRRVAESRVCSGGFDQDLDIIYYYTIEYVGWEEQKHGRDDGLFWFFCFVTYMCCVISIYITCKCYVDICFALKGRLACFLSIHSSEPFHRLSGFYKCMKICQNVREKNMYSLISFKKIYPIQRPDR